MGRRQPELAALVQEPALTALVMAYLENRKLRLRASTARVDSVHLELFLRFAGEGATASVLSRALLDEFMAWLRRPDTGLHERQRGMTSVIKSVRAAQLMWRWADESERWPGFIPRPRQVELPRATPALVVAPSWEEMDACVLACDAQGWQRKLATWLRFTGLRAGESMLLFWDDLDMRQGRLTIRPEIDKNNAGRVIPLSPLVLDEVAGWGKREGYLIPTARHVDCQFHRDPRARDIRRAWVRAGVRPEVWRQRPDHAFRRGFKSGLLALGADRDAVDYLQGHQLGMGSRGRYIDPAALPLAETVRLVPQIGTGKVIRLGVKR